MGRKIASFAVAEREVLRDTMAVTVSDVETGEGLTALVDKWQFIQSAGEFLRKHERFAFSETISLASVEWIPPGECLLHIDFPNGPRATAQLDPKSLQQLVQSLQPPESMSDEWRSTNPKGA